MSMSNSSDLNLTGIIEFRTPFLHEVLDWAIENVYSRVWDSNEWIKCAKGGDENEKFSKHKDMDYLAHIFSGSSMALKVLDYCYQKRQLNSFDLTEEIKLLKRSLFCYLFHDYNKLTNSDYKMKDKDSLVNIIDRYFGELKDDLNLSNDDIYQVAFSTENGTIYNIIRDSNHRANLSFESNFSTLADKLSSVYNDLFWLNFQKEEQSIFFGNEPIVQGKYIKKILFAETSLYASEDVARKACKITIEKLGGFYLWSTNRAIFYIFENDDSNVLSNINEEFANIVNKILEPENLLSFNDRSVLNTAKGIVNHTKDSILKYVSEEDRFRKCFWLEDIEITSENRNSAEIYSEAVKSLTTTFSINFINLRERAKMSIREGLQIFEVYDKKTVEERLKIFMARYVQLKSSLKTNEANKMRSALNSILSNYQNTILKGLLGKIPKNSVLLLPFIIENKDIDWDALLNDVLSDLNHVDNSVDYAGLLSKILIRKIDTLILSVVPNKFNMSMINAFPAHEKATSENLSGINTQSFNNRLPTSGISNGKIDSISKFEFALRKNLVPLSKSSDECLMFLSFPGAIPFMDMSEYLTRLSYSRNEELSERNDLKLSIDSIKTRSREVRLDSAYFYSIRELDSEAEILRRLYQAISIYKKTKMLIRLSYSNAPFFQDQYEAIRVEVGSSICSSMRWDKIRCNQIDKVLDQIITFNVVGNGSLNKINFKDTATIVGDYIFEPMSLFYHVHKLIFGRDDRKNKGFGKQFFEKVESVRKLGYGVECDGGRKMNNVTELAKSAAKLVRPNWKMSGNDRTWMLRESLEVIEKARVSTVSGEERDLSEYKEFIGGHILKTLDRDKSITWTPKESDIADFAEKLIKLLKEDFGSRVPSGSIKSYLIDAFEFEYMRI